jgi:hypothetical protein
MGSLLGAMFLGLSILASKTHVAPFESGTPTVISQVGDLIYGPTVLGHVLYYCLQGGCRTNLDYRARLWAAM